MPIPHDLDWRPTKAHVANNAPAFDPGKRRLSEESIRTEDCDGLMPDSPDEHTSKEQEEGDKGDQGETLCTDRAELIERIKRGESPTWVPNQALKQEYLRANGGATSRISSKTAEPQVPSPLLPAVTFRDINRSEPDVSNPLPTRLPEIQRPRSALHAGNFTQDATTSDRIPLQESPRGLTCSPNSLQDGPLGTSPTTPWYSPPSSFHDLQASLPSTLHDTSSGTPERRPWRSRAPSLNSYSSSNYVLKAPTTPLVQQSNNADLDFSPRDRSLSPEKSTRRRTLPPHAFHSMHTDSHSSTLSQLTRPPSSIRQNRRVSYSHQPRRSLTSNWSLQTPSSPQTPPYLRSRKTSFSSEISPLQHASMVGSYEESILRGWMSTAPSKPLDFTAQIGVLGRGSCKPKCPAHITIPFPAVFYSWSAGNGRSTVRDDPSPYVGHIDLQQSAVSAELRRVLASEVNANIGSEVHKSVPDHDALLPNLDTRKSKKRRRASPSSAPPGGSYRIPQQGQLQIIIKNPNKTAVKLFLVPYDLEMMEPGTKTFIRQRSYSADPTIENSLDQKAQLDRALSSRKPILRYLIHLNICSPSKGRFFLYQQIRVVFANRVPDNKEHLRNEIHLPQPRYSAYRPHRQSMSGTGSSVNAKVTTEKAYQRRNSSFNFGAHELESSLAQPSTGGTTFPFPSDPTPPIPAVPFNLTTLRQKLSAGDCDNHPEAMELDVSRPTTSDDSQSPLSDRTNRCVGVQLSSSYKSSSSQGSNEYSKLNRGDSGYGGLGRPGTPEPGDGLLARRLKGLGVRRENKAGEDEI